MSKSQEITVLKKTTSNLPDINTLPEERQVAVNQLVTNLDINNVNAILDFGSDVHTALSKTSDGFIEAAKLDRADEVSGAVGNLLNELSELDTSSLNEGGFKGLLMKIPGFKFLSNGVAKFKQKYDTIAGNIDDIVTHLDKTQISLSSDNTKLEDMFNDTLYLIEKIEDLIIACNIKIESLNKEIEEDISNGVDKINIDVKRDAVHRLKKRMTDLVTTRTMSIQSLPQIKVLQSNNISSIEQIRTSINTVIPIWKREMGLSLAIINQKKASKTQQLINDVTKNILEKNAERLKINTIEIAQENEKAIVPIETIEKVHKTMIETLTEVKKIREKGTNDREQVLTKLLAIKNTLEIENKNTLKLENK